MNTVKILVVDDDLDTRNILQEILRTAGFTVSAAEDGEQGLRMVRADRPALVISDILMPGVDGFQFLRAVRQDSTLKDLPVVFYTGNYLDREDEKLAHDLGVSKFLLKPVTPADLVAVVKGILEHTGKKQETTPLPAPLKEPEFLKLYNERLVSKLKHKVLENESTRRSLEHILEGIADGVVVIDSKHTIVMANTACTSSLGRDRSDVIRRKCFEVLHGRETPCEDPNMVCPYVHIFTRGESIVKTLHTHCNAQGDEKHIEITASAIRDAKGKTLAMVETYRDIMEKDSDDELVKLVKRLNDAQIRLKHMAVTDELTGLANRRFIIERLDEEFERASRSGHPLSLIMLDIDHFKLTNDTYGHLFGDMVLQAVASRIKSSLRRHDLVGRVGGEEFLVICPESSLEDTMVVAERIRKIVNEETISNDVISVKIALSAGVTERRHDDTNFEKLFSRSDAALYKAKEAGRNRVEAL